MNNSILWFFLIATINICSMVGATLPEHPVCGVYTGDRTSPTAEYPWTAHIIYTKPKNKKGIHCRGTLINERYVLTGGHCLSKLPKSFTLTHVKLGGINSTNDIRVTQTILNENYVPASMNQLNDIALLKLEKDVQFSDKIQPICLSVGVADRNADLSSEILEVSEYGRTTTGNRINVHEVPNSSCKASYQTIDIVDSQICAGSEVPRDSCKGNGGGALMKYGTSTGSNSKHYVQVGISSFGPNQCGTKDFPDVYTRVSDFMDWIISKVN